MADKNIMLPEKEQFGKIYIEKSMNNNAYYKTARSRQLYRCERLILLYKPLSDQIDSEGV